MNTVLFVGLIAFAEVAVVWLAYSLGHQSGWLAGWDEGRK